MEWLRRLHWNERTVPPERARRLTGIRINSKSFVNDLLKANNLDPTKNHPITGVYSEKTNSVIFKINPDTEN